MVSMFKSPVDPEVRRELAAFPGWLWLLWILPVLLASNPTWSGIAGLRGVL